MLRGRDIFWAVVICLLLNVFWYYRPLWSAREFVREQGQAGFVRAYAGHRFIDGRLVSRDGGVANPMLSTIQRHRFNIRAEHLSWNGERAEFVIRHVVILLDGTPAGRDLSQDLHVKLQRTGNRWTYRHFEVRDHGPLDPATGGNPFARALELARGPRS